MREREDKRGRHAGGKRRGVLVVAGSLDTPEDIMTTAPGDRSGASSAAVAIAGRCRLVLPLQRWSSQVQRASFQHEGLSPRVLVYLGLKVAFVFP